MKDASFFLTTGLGFSRPAFFSPKLIDQKDYPKNVFFSIASNTKNFNLMLVNSLTLYHSVCVKVKLLRLVFFFAFGVHVMSRMRANSSIYYIL